MPNVLLERLMILIPLVLSLTVHEWSHAYCAFRLGDDTATREGRLTLNPLEHIDMFGTILLPMLGIPFGWARPVPVRPERFRRTVSMRKGMVLTAAAGPASNVVLALLCAVAYGLLLRFRPDVATARSPLPSFLFTAIEINVALALFNLLPIPPLDGSRVVDGLLPERLRPSWEQLTRFAPFMLLAVIFFGGQILSVPRMYADMLLGKLLMFIAG